MIWFIIKILELVLKAVLFLPCIIWGSIESICKGQFSKWYKELALASDIYGNILIKYPANKILIKKTGYKFGQLCDTISKVLGLNKRDKTLRRTGSILCKGLNKLDNNHVEKAIK